MEPENIVLFSDYKNIERRAIVAEERAAQLEAELKSVIERERLELIEWNARVTEQFDLRRSTKQNRDEVEA
jgi:hypothetical protein